ncbi:hypothetical protein V6N13_121381 [Hibiscus sabdariffa]|uniref:S-protein homolog n=1 Tax=Hibiscus sabdariffa TaxID=183260 RepID=A0ABR2PDW7_9ROSI
MVHCKSRNDDLRVRILGYRNHFEFKFRPQFWRSTLFHCTFKWNGVSHRPSGRLPDFSTVWPALTPAKEDRPAESGVNRGVDIDGEGRKGIERLDGDGLRDMEVSTQPVEAVNDHGVVAVSGGTEGHKEGARKVTFKDMIMGSMEHSNSEYPIEDMEVEYGHTLEICGSGEVEHGSLDRQHGKEKSDMAVYGPWMQAPSRGRRVGQNRKMQGDKGLPNGGANGSRFAVLSMHDETKGSDADVVTA